MEFIDLKEQYRRYKPQIDERIQRVLGHAHFIMGPEIAEVEQALAAGMSDVFFAELGIPAPDFNLGLGSANHSLQTSEMF